MSASIPLCRGDSVPQSLHLIPCLGQRTGTCQTWPGRWSPFSLVNPSGITCAKRDGTWKASKGISGVYHHVISYINNNPNHQGHLQKTYLYIYTKLFLKKNVHNSLMTQFCSELSCIAPCRASRFSDAGLFGDGGQQGLQILTLAKCSDHPFFKWWIFHCHVSVEGIHLVWNSGHPTCWLNMILETEVGSHGRWMPTICFNGQTFYRKPHILDSKNPRFHLLGSLASPQCRISTPWIWMNLTWTPKKWCAKVHFWVKPMQTMRAKEQPTVEHTVM